MKKLLIVIYLVVFSLPTHADSLKCGKKLVSTGDTKSEVLFICGNPNIKDYVGVEKIGDQYVHIDHWTYYQNEGKFMKILIFYDSILKSVKNGPRM